MYAFCIIQNTLFNRMTNDKDVVYLDFEDTTQIDKMINALQDLKSKVSPVQEENADESKAES